MKKRKFPTHCVMCKTKEVRAYNTAFCSGCMHIAERVKNKVYALVKSAVYKNKLPSPYSLKCVDCGADATIYDHRDYSKPLEVEAVCHSCNIIRGPAIYPEALAK